MAANSTLEDKLVEDDNLEEQFGDKVKIKEIVVIVFIMGIWFYSLYRQVSEYNIIQNIDF